MPSYTVWIEVDAAENVAHMGATLGSLPRDRKSVDLSFPERFAFVTLRPRFTAPLYATANGRTLAFPERLSDFRFRVATGGAETVELTWSIALDHREQPEVIAGNDGYEHSFVEPRLGMLFTAELVPTPEIQIDRVQVSLRGEFEGSVLSPWRSSVGQGEGTATWAPSMGELSDDILLLGDGWTTVETEAAGLLATFALAPGSEWLKPAIEERLVPVVQTEVDLFGWAPQERFLFAFGPSAGTPGYGGSPKAGSMTLFVSEELPKDVARESVTHLIAHEFHHLWAHGTLNQSDDLRFVGEGYTDYYAYIVPWRLGMISDATLHKTLESRLAAGAAALDKYGRSLTAAGGPEFFAGREAYDACYAAGLALALWTDLALRKNGQPEGLDELLREWYRSTPTVLGNKENAEVRSVGIGNWKSHLASRLPASQVDHYMGVIEGTGSVDWEALFDAVDLVVERVDATFHISPSCLPRLR